MLSAKRLHEPFVLAALAVGLTAGFGYGAFLVSALAFGVRPGAWYGALVQAHGHAQLFGWIGLFILGVGLYFLPRLRGTKLQGTERLPAAFVLLVAGIGLRSLAQPLAGLASGSAGAWLRALVLLSALLEMAGMLVIGSMLLATLRQARPLPPDAPAYPVEPLVRLAFACLTLAFFFNLLGVWNLFLDGRATLAPRYDQLGITLVLYGTAVPVTMVFALRNLPLYLRLALPARDFWRVLALIYAAALMLRVLPFLVSIVDDALLLTGGLVRANFVNALIVDALGSVGLVALNVCLLVFVWRLDLLHQRPRQTAEGLAEQWSELERLRKPMRTGVFGLRYPDAGEFGRFELLVYSAFAWLVVSIALELVRVVPGLNERVPVTQDAARHALTVGYLTLLIFGMAVRMLPGFSGKRSVASPELVMWTFVLGNLAALARVVPALFPSATLALGLWGLSGFVGWCAVLVLGVNLWATFRGG